MARTYRVSIMHPIYVDIEADDSGDIDDDAISEALYEQYGSSKYIEIRLDYAADWEIIDEWEND